MIKVITESKKIERLHKKFQATIQKYLTEEIDCWVGFQGGNFQDNVHYSEKLNVWISVQELENRFWNGFGIGKPIEGRNNSLVAEVNFPYEGINRKIAGVFARERNGNILVLHRGKIGGGKPGVGKELFCEHFRGDFVTAVDGDLETEFCMVGELNSKHFPVQIANFIKEVYRIKNLELVTDFDHLMDFSYTEEHYGKSVTERTEPVVINRIHGIVVNTLAERLKGMGLKIGSDRNRDLFIHHKGKIKTLFEIKTTCSTSCLYAAIGQLLLYTIPIKNSVQLIAVLPDKLSVRVKNRFNSLGIELLYFDWEDDLPKFKNLDDILKP